MATDATGTPTSLGIPKFDVTNDAPSGLGSNAQMDSIDGLLAQTPRSGSIAGIAVGSVPVWNGTAWVKPSGTPDGTKFLRDDGTWAGLGTFSNHTPVWTSSGTAPSPGNAFLSGRYTQIGKLVVYIFRVIFGSTSTFGTGVYFFSLPVTASGSLFAGSAYVQDTSTGNVYGAIARWGSTTTFAILDVNSSLFLSNTAPFTFAQDDVIEATITYEAA